MLRSAACHKPLTTNSHSFSLFQLLFTALCPPQDYSGADVYHRLLQHCIQRRLLAAAGSTEQVHVGADEHTDPNAGRLSRCEREGISGLRKRMVNWPDTLCKKYQLTCWSCPCRARAMTFSCFVGNSRAHTGQDHSSAALCIGHW